MYVVVNHQLHQKSVCACPDACGMTSTVMKPSATKNQHLYRTHWKVLGQYFKPEFVLSSNKKMYFKGTQFSAL